MFRLSTLRTIADILGTHSDAKRVLNSEIWKTIKPGLDLLAFSTLWAKQSDTEHALDGAFVRELSLLAARASCSLPHDKIYALLGLFPSPVSSIVAIDYNREAAGVIAEFISAVPQWTEPPVGDQQSASTGGS